MCKWCTAALQQFESIVLNLGSCPCCKCNQVYSSPLSFSLHCLHISALGLPSLICFSLNSTSGYIIWECRALRRSVAEAPWSHSVFTIAIINIQSTLPCPRHTVATGYITIPDILNEPFRILIGNKTPHACKIGIFFSKSVHHSK